jgi:hypothetical protein
MEVLGVGGLSRGKEEGTFRDFLLADSDTVIRDNESHKTLTRQIGDGKKQ